MPGLPAVCDRGHRYEDRSVFLGEGTSAATFIGNRVGPCPFCGAMASVVDGTYDVRGGRAIRRVVTDTFAELSRPGVTVDELQLLRGILEEARSSSATLEEIKERIDSEASTAGTSLGWLKSPTGMATAAWLAVLLGIIAIVIAWKGQGSESSSPIPQAEIEQIVQQAERGLTQQSTSAAKSSPTRSHRHPSPIGRPSSRPTGGHQRGHERCACGSKKQFKNCCGKGRR
ncbi:MAG: hypothetical protein ABSC90_13665 [Acidimicrobiales bacterium]|jgi:hypothetical protein